MTQFRTIDGEAPDGGVQLAASADRWHLTDDYVHLSPHHTGRRQLLQYDAQLKPIVDNPVTSAALYGGGGSLVGPRVAERLTPHTATIAGTLSSLGASA